MTTGPAVRRRYQFSVRSLLIVTAVSALLLIPVVWVVRERRQILRAREEALRAVVLAERYRSELRGRQAAGPPNPGLAESRGGAPRTSDRSDRPAADSALIEQLRRENAELKATIKRLRREVERLQASNPP